MMIVLHWHVDNAVDLETNDAFQESISLDGFVQFKESATLTIESSWARLTKLGWNLKGFAKGSMKATVTLGASLDKSFPLGDSELLSVTFLIDDLLYGA